MRQEGIIPSKLLEKRSITVIGAGAVGSFSALTLAKMGVPHIVAYDEDGVEDHNLPNQFYRKEDKGQYKVDALQKILEAFSDAEVVTYNTFYTKQKLNETVVVATDSMRSRRLVWEEFKKQRQTKIYIEARMGAELGAVYIIRKKNGKIAPRDIKFYESRLYKDEDVKPLPCTARSIIYNVLMLSSLVCRAFKGIITGQKTPRELVFNMTLFDARSFMFTK